MEMNYITCEMRCNWRRPKTMMTAGGVKLKVYFRDQVMQ